MAKTKRRLSEAERAERRERDRQRLQRAAEELLTSEGWQRWVRVRSQVGLARLSLSNQLLVALARPDATFVAGFKAWPRLGYAVKTGERAIAIIAPLPVKERDRLSGEETGETVIFFKTVFVFDRAQVVPIDGVEQAPLEPPCEPLTGDSHAHLIAPLQTFAELLGFTVSFETINGPAGGWCDQKAKRIVVDADAPANARLRTVIHETIHGLGVGYAEYGRERAEVIVDTRTSSAPASGLRSTARASPTSRAGAKTARWPPRPGSPPRSTGSPARSTTPSPALLQPRRAERRTIAAESAQIPQMRHFAGGQRPRLSRERDDDRARAASGWAGLIGAPQGRHWRVHVGYAEPGPRADRVRSVAICGARTDDLEGACARPP
jgi:hypothetical protein